MSAWNHNICQACWNKKNPDREPVRIKPAYAYLATCCYCGAENRDGIYVREDPAKMKCYHAKED